MKLLCLSQHIVSLVSLARRFSALGTVQRCCDGGRTQRKGRARSGRLLPVRHPTRTGPQSPCEDFTTSWYMKHILTYYQSVRCVHEASLRQFPPGPSLYLGPPVTAGEDFSQRSVTSFFRTYRSSSSQTGFRIISLKNMFW